jgi:hypothetical protein
MNWYSTHDTWYEEKMRRNILVCLVLVVCLVNLATPVKAQTPGNVHLASLDIAIWPEYDQPSALVIYRGQVAADVTLPANVYIRIPASAVGGQPHAVAVEDPNEPDPAKSLLNLPNTVTPQDGWLLVSFTIAYPAFQVEFYDEMDVSAPQRHYTLTWPGDMNVDDVTLQIQQPFGSTDFSVTPAVEQGQRRDDGLMYYPADLGSLQAGQQVSITLAYTKTDTRTSVEALSLAASAPPQQTAPQSPISFSQSWVVAVGLVVGIGLVVTGVVWYMVSRRGEEVEYITPAARREKRGRKDVRGHAVPRSRRQQPSEPAASAQADYCTQCGKLLDPTDIFCPQCGARRR